MEINWKQIFFHDLDWSLAASVALRSLIMFLIVLLFLRLSGKKGVRQLSIFEVAIIIALGTAAGDPMLNEESAIIPSLIVFTVILAFYRLITYIASKNERFETILEGEPVYIIEEGRFTLQKADNTLAKDEFFAEMRVEGIEHIGQVKTAILETNGKVSFFYFEDDDVKPGLPVLPKPYAKRSKLIAQAGSYACTNCGQVEQLSQAAECPRCDKDEWVKSMHTKRIT